MEKVTEQQVADGLEKLRALIKDHVSSGNGADEVRSFMSKVAEKDDLLVRFLKGRKMDATRAFETVKRMGEVRFIEYPDVYTKEVPQLALSLQDRGIWGVLKTRDSLGRRIICFDAAEWNPKEFNLTDLTKVGTWLVDSLLYDDDAVNNGIILLQNSDKMGFSHCRFYTLPAMQRLLNLFWNAFPLMFKGLYFANCPTPLRFLHELIRPFFSKKLKERIRITGHAKKFEEIHANISPDILPKFLGGAIENTEAFDKQLLLNHVNFV